MRLLRIAVSLFVILAGTLGLAEWYLSVRNQDVARRQPRFQTLFEAHSPFARKRPDSSFGFFLPATDSSSVSSIHLSNGRFRGPGPDASSGRPLAFLVGNSVVFGFAEHDSLTITGFLNRLQDDYFFVNAGVPSWVSSQMRRRVIGELLDYKPALILFWGGHNDASLAYRTRASGQPYVPGLIEPPSTEESPVWRLLGGILPHTTERIRRRLTGPPSISHTVDLDVARAAAEAFVANLEASRRAAASTGASFLAVYQPILHHHANRPSGSVNDEQLLFFARFRAHAFDQAARREIPLVDLSALFDTHFSTVPVFRQGEGPDIQDQVFVDAVHLYVPGNELVAKALITHLSASLRSRTVSR